MGDSGIDFPLGQMLTHFVFWSCPLLLHGKQSDHQRGDDTGSTNGPWLNTTEIYEPTTGYNVTTDDAHKRYIYTLTFRITLALCLISIVIVTTILVLMVLYAKYKGWKSRNATSSAPVTRSGDAPRPAPFPMSSHRPSIAKNPTDPPV